MKQGRLLRFINGNDLSICWSQFTRVSWAQHTMGQPTYELPAPLRRVYKTTGIAAGEHPETPPSCTDHQMTQMGRNQTKTRLPLYKEGPLSKAIHATNWGNLAMQHSGFALLLAWALRHSKRNQIYGSLLQRSLKSSAQIQNNSSLAMLTRNSLLFSTRVRVPGHFSFDKTLPSCTIITKVELRRKTTHKDGADPCLHES